MDLRAAAMRVSGSGDVLLFVYGTLREGEEADGLLDGAASLGPAETAAAYSLEHVGEGDLGMREGGSDSVSGELYLVGPGDLARVDEWEAGGGFSRQEVSLSDGSKAEAYLLS